MGVLLKKVICNVFSYECCEWYLYIRCVHTHSHSTQAGRSRSKQVETYFDIHDM